MKGSLIACVEVGRYGWGRAKDRGIRFAFCVLASGRGGGGGDTGGGGDRLLYVDRFDGRRIQGWRWETVRVVRPGERGHACRCRVSTVERRMSITDLEALLPCFYSELNSNHRQSIMGTAALPLVPTVPSAHQHPRERRENHHFSVRSPDQMKKKTT